MFELNPCSEIMLRNKNTLGLGVDLAFSSMCIEYLSMVPDRKSNFASSDVLHNYQAEIHCSFDKRVPYLYLFAHLVYLSFLSML